MIITHSCQYYIGHHRVDYLRPHGDYSAPQEVLNATITNTMFNLNILMHIA